MQLQLYVLEMSTTSMLMISDGRATVQAQCQ